MLISEIKEKYRGLKIPWEVHFELTYNCNLKCIHCYVSAHQRNDVLCLIEIKNIIDQLKEMGTVLLTFSGGEIFTMEDLLEIIKYATKNFIVILLTNGTLITPRKIKELKNAGVTQVEISLYGANDKVHDQITCVPGSYSKTMRTLNLLQKERIPAVIKHTTMQQNIHEYHEIKKIAMRLGARLSISHFLLPKTDRSKGPLSYRIDDCNKEKYFAQRIPKKFDRSDFKKGLCNAGTSSCSISPFGIVSPCVILPFNLGSLRENTFKEIWLTKPVDTLEKLRVTTQSDIIQCQDCDISDFCNPCPGINYLECENIIKCPSEFCRTTHWMTNGLTHSKKGG